MDAYAPKSLLTNIPTGLDGVRHTLRAMTALVRVYKSSPMIRHQAVILTASLPQKDYKKEVETIHRFVRDNIRYVRDIRKVETLQTPEYTLSNRSGDCDDKSTLTAALLESLGHPTRFVAIGFSPNNCSHVFPEVKIGGRGEWVPVETTEPVHLGWMPEGVKKSIVIEN